MSLKYGKTEIAAIVQVLDGEHETVEDAAKAALAAMEEIFEKRAKFVVVGQLAATKERASIPPSEPEAIKLSLGWYSTKGDAISAAESLWSSTATGDTFRTWVLPVFHGTPAELHKKRKEAYEKSQADDKQAKFQKLRDQIEKRAAEAQRRADEIQAIEKRAGQPWPCPARERENCRHEPKCK